ncbi:hypothetical protein [Actinomyces succiniciruminis]|uniref:Uncharacterized protein n=1 Tax=Actinomyces succiniciruminis TaxID=1522002 RepID=A0A1L7R9T0_9ACTO|nr:hypothetical protein [Actinomyces succiniciruminis]CED90597.1 Hypothetical protein AAM4_0765 [Actinomyces succiniciruminis]
MTATTTVSARDLAGLIPAGASSAPVPDSVAYELLERLAAAGGPATCAHGHEWSVATARVRVRRRLGRGITLERDCRVCKHEAYREARRHTRHQMKGGRLT